MDKKKMISLLSVALAVLGVAIFILRKPIAPPPVGTGIEVSQQGPAIFTQPTGVTEAPLLIVYGGLTTYPWARRQAMADAMPNFVKLRTFCLFLDYNTMTLRDAVAFGKRIAAQRGLQITDVKAMGFSAGAIPVQMGLGEELSFVGLIDPSTRSGFLSADFGSRARMLYNPANWGGYPDIKTILPRLDQHIREQGGTAQALRLPHEKFPALFFQMFQNELVTPGPSLLA